MEMYLDVFYKIVTRINAFTYTFLFDLYKTNER